MEQQQTDAQIETYRLVPRDEPPKFEGLHLVNRDWLAEHGAGTVSWSSFDKFLTTLSKRIVNLMTKAIGNNFKVLSDYHDTVEKRLIESTRKIHALERTVAALERAHEKTLADSFRGTWQPGTFYTRGGLSVWDGSLWLCMADTGEKPGSSDSWRMVTKRGKDAKP